MSTDYWRMKLEGSAVYHNNTFFLITAIEESESEKEEGYDPTYPDNLLPYLKFRCTHPAKRNKTLKYDDFEIFFPDDQAYLTDGKLSWARRSMSRSYKIAPTKDLYGIADKSSFIKFLQQTMSPEFSPPEEVWLFDETDRLFSKNIGSVASGRDRHERTILFRGKRIAVLQHKEDTLRIKCLYKKALPREFLDLFGEYLDLVLPYSGGGAQEEGGYVVWIDDYIPSAMKRETIYIRFDGENFMASIPEEEGSHRSHFDLQLGQSIETSIESLHLLSVVNDDFTPEVHRQALHILNNLNR